MRQVLRKTQRALRPGDDGQLQQWVGARQEPGHDPVPALVVGDYFSGLGRDQMRLLLDASDDPLSGQLEVLQGDEFVVVPGGHYRSLVA